MSLWQRKRDDTHITLQGGSEVPIDNIINSDNLDLRSVDLAVYFLVRHEPRAANRPSRPISVERMGALRNCVPPDTITLLNELIDNMGGDESIGTSNLEGGSEVSAYGTFAWITTY